jgi:hypothetical protein
VGDRREILGVGVAIALAPSRRAVPPGVRQGDVPTAPRHDCLSVEIQGVGDDTFARGSPATTPNTVNIILPVGVVRPICALRPLLSFEIHALSPAWRG